LRKRDLNVFWRYTKHVGKPLPYLGCFTGKTRQAFFACFWRVAIRLNIFLKLLSVLTMRVRSSSRTASNFPFKFFRFFFVYHLSCSFPVAFANRLQAVRGTRYVPILMQSPAEPLIEERLRAEAERTDRSLA
jgi:hypothetical protein